MASTDDTVELWGLPVWGWSMVSQYSTPTITVDIWTRDERVLTVSWAGETSTVTAALLDGQPVSLDQLHQTVCTETAAAPQVLWARAATKLTSSTEGTLTDVDRTTATLLESASRTPARIPFVISAALHDLALAILASPRH